MIAGLYAIVDLPLRCSLALEDFVAAVCEGGARVLQVRGKNLGDDALTQATRRVLGAAGACPVIVNDRVSVARSVGAAGVHLGQSDWAALAPAARRDLCRGPLCVGLSTHNLAQVREAAELGLDYFGFGPVFATSTKMDAEPVTGLAGLAGACGLAHRPVVAIGGITPDLARTCVQAGAGAVASVGGLLAEDHAAVRALAFAYARNMSL